MDNTNSWGGSLEIGGAYWSENAKVNAMDELLGQFHKREREASLEAVLEEQIVLQEVMAPNPSLVTFLIDRLDEMLDYVCLGKPRMEKPSIPKHQSKEHYAYVCCKILSINVPAITTAIVESESRLTRFFQILNLPAPLSARSAGYFHQILLILCQKNPSAILKFVSKTRTSSGSFSSADSYSVGGGGGNVLDKNGGALPIRGAKRRFSESETEAAAAVVSAMDDSPASSSSPGMGNNGGLSMHQKLFLARNSSEERWSSGGGNASASEEFLGLVPKFLKHIDSYSMTCAFLVLLQTAADQTESRTAMDSSSIGRQTQKNSATRATYDDLELLRARKLWTGGLGTVFSVLALLGQSDDPYVHSNAGDILVEMFRRAAGARASSLQRKQVESLRGVVEDDEAKQESREAFSSSSPLASLSSSEEWTVLAIDALCDLILASKIGSSASDSATKVLNAAVIAFSQPFAGGAGCVGNGGGFGDGGGDEEDVIAKQNVDFTCPLEIETLLKRLSKLAHRLVPENGVETELLDTQWGGQIAKFGVGRLLLVELISYLVLCGYPSVAKEIADMEPDPLGLCLDSFFNFPFNNMLHSVVEKTFRAVLVGDSPGAKHIELSAAKDPQSRNVALEKTKIERAATLEALVPLEAVLFGPQMRLVERILDAYEKNAAAERVVEERYVLQTNAAAACDVSADSVDLLKTTPWRPPAAYMGHLNSIANGCADLIASQTERGGPAFDALDAALKQRWFEFVHGKLSEIKRLTSQPLGGAPLKRDGAKSANFHSPGGSLSSFGSSSISGLFGIHKDMDLKFGGDDDDDVDDDNDDDDDEDEDEDDEENLMKKYNLTRDPVTKRIISNSRAVAAAVAVSKPVVAMSPSDSGWVADFSDDDVVVDANTADVFEKFGGHEVGVGLGVVGGGAVAAESAVTEEALTTETSEDGFFDSPNAVRTGASTIDDFFLGDSSSGMDAVVPSGGGGYNGMIGKMHEDLFAGFELGFAAAMSASQSAKLGAGVVAAVVAASTSNLFDDFVNEMDEEHFMKPASSKPLGIEPKKKAAMAVTKSKPTSTEEALLGVSPGWVANFDDE